MNAYDRHPRPMKESRSSVNDLKTSPGSEEEVPEMAGRAVAVAESEVLIVGLGASAGGLPALELFFEALPDEVGRTAFVIVMHLSPDHKSALASCLQPHTKLPVLQVQEKTRIEAGHVYVIPPGKLICLADGHLVVKPFDQPRFGRTPIDEFFSSLAEVGGRAIGIVLSGGGADGTVGLKRVKEHGGIVMVQDPDDAHCDSMPRSAIANGLADFILPAAELAQKVIDYRDGRALVRLSDKTEIQPRKETEGIADILAELHRRTGRDFATYKRSTVVRRIEGRMQMNKVATLSDYLVFLRENPSEAKLLLKNFLISVTHFFRDAEAFAALAEKSLPRLFAGKGANDVVRAWVPGCATGEEAYTLAILLMEHAAQLDAPPGIQIFATDLDEAALAFARRGLYSQAIAADLSEERLKCFFSPEDNQLRVNTQVRERVLFATHNLLSDPPFSRLDFISCRNVLIYLNGQAQERVFQLFHYGLKAGGYLFLGNAESVDGDVRLFKPLDSKYRIYRRKDGDPQERGDIPPLEISRGPASGHLPEQERGTPARPSELGMHQRMLEQHAPPSIVVNRTHEMVHLSEHAGRYLQRPPGLPSSDVLLEVRPELRPELRAALFDAFEHGRDTTTGPIQVKLNGSIAWVHMIVQAGREESDTREGALVLFAELSASAMPDPGGAAPGVAEGREDAEILRLLAEVRRLEVRLRAAIEEHDRSQEDMNAANEELQSMNEEYKSAAEELETSQEELQSVNEELETTNQELERNIEQFRRVNSDLHNLMAATDIATLFLDNDLCIQRYTPGITKLFNILPGDVGRPLAHLSHQTDYDQLNEDAEKVLRDLTMVERNVRGSDDTCFLVRLRSYRSVDDRIEGVVVTFVDITELDTAQRAQQQAQEYSERLVDTVREGLIVLDRDFRVLSANESFYNMFQVGPQETIGARMYDLGNGQWEIPEIHELLEKVLPEKGAITDFSVEHDFKSIGHRVMTLNISQLANLPQILVAIEDSTMRDQTIRRLRETDQVLAERTRQVHQLASTLTMAEQDERRRISQILHDDLQQRLYGIRMKLDFARQMAQSGKVESALAHLEIADCWLRTAVTVTRRLTVDLSPPVLKEEGLSNALFWLRTQMQERHSLEVTVKAEQAFGFLHEDLRVLLFQIVRELLFNVVKHAQTKQATVAVEDAGNEIVIRVSDEGCGFDFGAAEAESKHEGGFGLFSIRERLKLFGGSMEIDSKPSKGTRVWLRAPLEPANDRV